MRTARLILIVGVLGAASLVAPGTALASVIDITAGVTLFSDNFESQPGDQISHGGYPDTSGDYDPTATAWTGMYEDAGGYNIQVTDAAGANGPGAYQGVNYLRIGRSVEYSACPYAEAGFTAPGTSHTLRIEQMLYLTSDDFGAMQLWITQANGNPDVVLRTNGGNVQAYCTDLPGDHFATIAGLSYALNQWQKWQVDWTPGTGELAISIDGAAPVASDIAQSRSPVARVAFSKGISGPFYVDEVPEPAGMVMLAAGMLGLVAYAWRKR